MAQREERDPFLQQARALTLEEACGLLSGADFWRTKALPEKQVPSVRLADGPHGLRVEDHRHVKQNGGHSVPATCFPTAGALACAWSPALAGAVAGAIAEECRAHGVSVLLGPGVNIKRSPLCGRNFEYFSEDPLLAGRLAAAYIAGMQEKGVAASLKHFALNSQERGRMRVSAEVDERALREVYLKPFELAVKQSRPATVMASYNRVNGTHATQNKNLLTDILRGEWGFDGLVMSDWGAVSDRAQAVDAGLDLEMPGSGGLNDRAVARAVREGRLPRAAVDKAAARVLRLAAEWPAARQPYDEGAHRRLARRAAAESAVLLKNDGILPLEEHENIAVIGKLATSRCRYQGAGSSLVNSRALGFTGALAKEGAAYVNYAPGYHLRGEAPDRALEEAAVRYARTARVVVYFMGLTEEFESEGYDRTHLDLPKNQTLLMEKLAAVNPNIVVVLAGGAPVAVPWLAKARAVLYMALGGQAVGEATADLLFGRINPAGKLAETWPLALTDTPCVRHYPMGPRAVTYSESIYVGYRYYDKAEKPVRFAFGHGLSYTSFAYSGLAMGHKVPRGCALKVLFTLENTGALAGDEIAQVYVGKADSAVYRPVRVLAGFARVPLAPGQQQLVTVVVPYDALAVWDKQRHAFVVEAGTYQVYVGASSRDIRLTGTVLVDGEALHPALADSAGGPYGQVGNNVFPDEDFYAIHGRPAQSNRPLKPGEYTMETTLGEMRASKTARRLEALAMTVALRTMHFSANPAVNRRVCAQSVRDLPFKNLAMNLAGCLSWEKLQVLLDVCNGKRRWSGALPALMKPQKGKKEVDATGGCRH